MTGLWHGASWNYVIWGVYYGILLCLEKFVYGKYLERVPKFFRHIYLCLIVVVGFTVFAIEDFSKLTPYLGSMFSTKGGFAGRDILFPALKKKISGFGCVAKKTFGIIYAVIFALLFVVAVSYMVSDTYNPFLYFRF